VVIHVEDEVNATRMQGVAEDCMEVMDMVTVVAELLELLMVEAEAVVVIKTLQLISYLLS